MWGLYFGGCAPLDHLHPLSDPDPLQSLPLEPEVIEALTEAALTQESHLTPDAACAQCHERQATEYARATMRYGFFSPTFNALELSLNQLSHGRFTHQEESSSEEREAFCSACHAPNAISQGLKVRGEDPTRAALSPTQVREGGIGCDLCHTAHTPRRPSAGVVVTPTVEKLSAHNDPAPNVFHSYLTPAQREGYGLSSSEFCAPCHDVRPRQRDVVTNTDHLRSEDLFSEWQQSPWADPDHPLNPLRDVPGIQGVHDAPETIARGERVTCQDCHMSLYPTRTFRDEVSYDEHFRGVAPSELTRKTHKLYPAGAVATTGHQDPADASRKRRVSTHYFSGVSHPLVPFRAEHIFNLAAATSETPEVWTDERAVSGARWRQRWDAWRALETGGRGAWGELRAAHERRVELLQAALTLSLDTVPERVTAESRVTLDAWIENTGAGHNIPAGFSQEREVWVALTLTDIGRVCTQDRDCEDLTEPAQFLNDPNRYCVVHGPRGDVDPALPANGAWEQAARAERSGLCGDEGRCVVYRSGYLIDRDGDGMTHDEDLRHLLIERDETRFEERCVLPGPDADVRVRGVERGLVHFTNALQRVDVETDGTPREHPNLSLLAPEAEPFDPWARPWVSSHPSDARARRSLYPTERALYEQSRYRPAPVLVPLSSDSEARGEPPRVQRGLGLTAPTLLSANRAFNGHALRPFEPRVARYQVHVPRGVIGPLKLDTQVRFRFLSPRLMRTLAARHPDLVREEMIDAGLEIVDMARATRLIQVMR